jgi:hypothetical protein
MDVDELPPRASALSLMDQLLLARANLESDPSELDDRRVAAAFRTISAQVAGSPIISLFGASAAYSTHRCGAVLAERARDHRAAHDQADAADDLLRALAAAVPSTTDDPLWWLPETAELTNLRMRARLSPLQLSRWGKLELAADNHVTAAMLARTGATSSAGAQRGVDDARHLAEQDRRLSEAAAEAAWMREPPVFSDARAFGWVVTTLTVTLTGALLGVAIFPPGSYPKIVLAAPGLALGALPYLAGPLFRATNGLVAIGAAAMFVLAAVFLLMHAAVG